MYSIAKAGLVSRKIRATHVVLSGGEMLGDWKGLNVYLWCESFSEAGNSLSILKDQISVAGRKRRGGREAGALDSFSSSFFLLSILLSEQDDDERRKE